MVHSRLRVQDQHNKSLRFQLRSATLVAILAHAVTVMAQCDPTVPTFIVDLSASPNATYLSPNVQRQDYCCGATSPDNCIQFILTLHPQAQGIIFNICSGAMPTGAMFYQVACGPAAAVGSALCLNGTGPHIITFCKPGGNTNEYCITSLPIPSAGPDIGVNDGCTGSISSTGYDPTTVAWTSIAPGATGAYNGYLACPTCPNTPVVAQPGYPAFVDYQICGAAIGACGSTPTCDTVRVYFFSTLTVNIQPTSPTVCFGATGTTITAVGAGGTPPYTFLWSTGETAASIYVDAGTYTVQLSDTSGCPPVTATVTVTEFTQPIQALAGTDIIVCGDGLPVQLNASVTGASGGQWISGNGAFLPSNTSLTATYMPTAAEISAGAFSLVLATTGNGTCPGDTDTVLVTLTNSFIAASSIGTDASCANGNDGTASFLPFDPTFTYVWNDPAAQTASTATALFAGIYLVTATDSYGCDTTLSVTISEPTPITIASIVVTDESCAGNNDGSVTVTASGGTGPYHFLWSTGDTTGTITVGAGTYTVDVTDANGCAPAQGTATVNATGLPNVANAGADLIGCLNDLPITVQGSVLNATGGSWSGGAGSILGSGLNIQYMPTAAEINAGGVDLTLTTTGNTSCPPASDVVHITLSNSFLNAALSVSNVTCNGLANGSISFSPACPSCTYQWNDPAGQITPNAVGLIAGTYSVTVTDGLGCDTTLTASITTPSALVIGAVNTTPVTCAGYSNGSASVSISGGTPGYSVLWSNSQTGPLLMGVMAANYVATVTDAQGCTVQATATITQPAPLTLSVLVPDTVCVNQPVTLTAQGSGGTGTLQYNWSGIGTTNPISHAFQTSQMVQVTVSDQAGCTGPTVSFPITVLNLGAATLTTYGATTVCPGGSATVGAALSGYPGSYTITWPELGVVGNGPFVVPVTGDQNLNVIVTDGCGNTLTAIVPLLLDVPPSIQLPTLIAEGCAPLTVQMPDLQLGAGMSYQWNLGNGSLSGSAAPFVIYPAGTYSITLTVTTAAGCTSSAPTAGQVISHTPPTAAFSSTPWTADIDHANIAFNDLSMGGVTTWAWNFGDGATSGVSNPSHQYIDIGTFQVDLYITDANGCTDEVTQNILITPVYDVVIPTAFTPDGHGGNGGGYDPNNLDNDIFYPFSRFVKDFRMRIFNRWGELIYESEDIRIGWDGYYRGELSPQDVYVVQTWIRFVDNREVQKLTDLTLFR